MPETKELGGPKGFDILGTILITAGLFGLVFALIEGQRYGWITPTATFSAAGWTWPSTTISIVAVAAVLAVIALAGFVVLELRRVKAGKVVVVDLRLFRIRTFGAGNVVALVVSLGEFGLLFALPLFLQATRGYDALETGVILLALAVGSFVASGLGAPLSQRMGPVRVLQLGMALEAIGIIGLGFVLSTTVTGWQMAPWLFVYGMGVGFATAQLTGVILSRGARRGVRPGQRRPVHLAAGRRRHRHGHHRRHPDPRPRQRREPARGPRRSRRAGRAGLRRRRLVRGPGDPRPRGRPRRRRPGRGRVGRLRRGDQARGLGGRRVRRSSACS